MSQLKSYPAELSSFGRVGFSLMRLLGDIGRRQLILKQYKAAEDSNLQVLQVISGIQDVDKKQRGKWNAATYHQLGMVAQEQRQWSQAEGYYQQALAIDIEFHNRYAQASTYHQLGRVAQAQRQWAQARDYFLKALTITVEFNDEYRISFVLRNLSRLWQAGGDAGLPGAVAAVLGVSVPEAEGRLRAAT